MELINQDLPFLLSNPQGQYTIIMLHGFPDNAYIWKSLIESLEKVAGDVTCLAPFAPGTLKGQDFDVGKFRLKTFGHTIQKMLQTLPIHNQQKVILVGHDMGGAYLEMLAELIPQTQAMIYIDTLPTSIFLNRLKGPRQWLQSSYMLLFQIPLHPQKRLGKYYDKIRHFIENAIGSDGNVDTAIGPESLNGLGFYRALAKDIFTKVKSSKKIPTFFIWGKSDLAISPPDQAELKKMKASLTIIGQGHWPMVSAPHDLALKINDIIKNTDKAKQ